MKQPDNSITFDLNENPPSEYVISWGKKISRKERIAIERNRQGAESKHLGKGKITSLAFKQKRREQRKLRKKKREKNSPGNNGRTEQKKLLSAWLKEQNQPESSEKSRGEENSGNRLIVEVKNSGQKLPSPLACALKNKKEHFEKNGIQIK